MKYKLNNCTLTLDLKPGIYSLGRQSATGKTYTLNLLKQVSAAYQEYKILAVSYNELTEEELIQRLSNNTYDIIMFDRYDIWGSKMIDYVLYKQKDNAIILLDVKDLNNVLFEINSLADIQINFGEVLVSKYVDSVFRRSVSC